MATKQRMLQGPSLAKRRAAGEADLAGVRSVPLFAGADKRLIEGLLTAGDPCWEAAAAVEAYKPCWLLAAVRRWVIRLAV